MKKYLLCSALMFTLAAGLMSGCNAKQESKAAAPGRASPAAKPAFQVDAATAGAISGVVKYDGPKPKPAFVDMSSDPACASTHKGKIPDETLLVGKGGGLGNAFVYVSKGLEDKSFAVPSASVTIDQKGCWFRPRVVGLQTGQTLDIVNSDPVTHNIHPMAKLNREWNHSQGPGDAPMHRTFTKQEIMIPVKCNIHEWMHAWIGVVDNQYFAVTKDDGSFTLPNLPPGTYTVTAWHEGLGTQEMTVTVAAKGSASTTLTFHAT